MSALIKGLEPSALPGGDVIRAEIRLIDGEVRLGIMTGGYTCSQVWTFYPLVRIPPHGRLIDADALIARIRRAKKLQPELSDLYENEALEMLLWVGTEPTVIESENPFFESLKTGLEQAINGDVREQTILEAEEVSE